LFLDEIDSLPLALQTRLLRALESRRVRPVGGDEEREIDVRVVAAAQQELSLAVARGEFRPDLYYRLSVLRVVLPPLRARREDLAPTIRELLARRGFEAGAIAGPGLERLVAYAWPGNVRELRNVLDRAWAERRGPRGRSGGPGSANSIGSPRWGVATPAATGSRRVGRGTGLALGEAMRLARGASITGRRRHNEDALLLAPDLDLYAVLDGVGGNEGGEIASQLAAATISEFFARSRDPDATWPYPLDPTHDLAHNRVAAAIRLANRAIRARRQDRLANMGTTVALVHVVGARIIVAHLGDSRVYRLRAGVLTPLTRDHSLYETLLAADVELPPLAEYPHAHVITRALGPVEDEQAEIHSDPLALGDRLLLCTDGLSGELEPARIAALLGRGDPDRACHALIEAALAAGSRDNITALVLDAD
jgi:PPM family protein phosphatase